MPKKITNSEQDLMWRFGEALRQQGIDSHDYSDFAAAYTMLLVRRKSQVKNVIFPNLDSALSLIEEDNLIKKFLSERLDHCWDRVGSLFYSFDEDIILKFIMQYSMRDKYQRFQTPNSIIELALKIMHTSPLNRVADMCAGSGAFLIAANRKLPDLSFYANEINPDTYRILHMKATLLEGNISISHDDVFSIEESVGPFDFIFCDPPFRLQLSERDRGFIFAQEMELSFRSSRMIRNADWIVNASVSKHLSYTGKAVVVMTGSSLFSTNEIHERLWFLNKNLIEAVIQLPAKLYSGISIPVLLVILSRNNDFVRMIDASYCCEEGRRNNILRESDVNNIYKLLNTDSNNSKRVPYETILSTETASLLPRNYLDSEALEIDNPNEFGYVIRSIRRGANISASDLDELQTDEPTGMQYLMLSNIKDGVIDKNLKNIKDDGRFRRYRIEKGNLIMSKNGKPFKAAVAEFDDDTKVIGNGNLFIIDVNDEKANVYYLQALFSSEVGERLLDSISVGASIPNISQTALSSLVIPLPPLAEQKKIAEKYKAKKEEMEKLQMRVTELKEELKSGDIISMRTQ